MQHQLWKALPSFAQRLKVFVWSWDGSPGLPKSEANHQNRDWSYLGTNFQKSDFSSYHFWSLGFFGDINQRQINSQSLEDAQASGLKSLGPINQPPWPTLYPIWISMSMLMSVLMSILMSMLMSLLSGTLSNSMSATFFFFFFVGLHIGHHNVVSITHEWYFFGSTRY